MKVNTIPDIEYTVTAPAGERCEVTATIGGVVYTLAVAYNGEQTRFQAVCGEVEVTSPRAIVRSLSGVSALAAPAEEPGVVKLLETPQGTGNTWWNYAVLNPALFAEGQLQRVAIRARSGSSGAHEIWLGVFEQPENGGNDPSQWVFVGASNEGKVQQNGTMTVWTFKNVPLHGRPIALCGMAARNTGWNMATQVGSYAAERAADDGVSVLVSGTTLRYVPQMQFEIREPLSAELMEHIGNAVVHLTAAERTKWDGKADAEAVQTHTQDAVVHITAAERTKWNGVTNKLPTSTFNTHKGDAVAHLTAAEHTGLTALLENKDALLGLLGAPAEQ